MRKENNKKAYRKKNVKSVDLVSNEKKREENMLNLASRLRWHTAHCKEEKNKKRVRENRIVKNRRKKKF